MKHPEMHTKVKVGKFFGGEKKNLKKKIPKMKVA